MRSRNSTRIARRGQILKELGLTPVWRAKNLDGRPEEFFPSQAQRRERIGKDDLDPPLERRTRIMQMNWEELKASAGDCTACPLCRSRSQGVFGVGDIHADWLYVGEGPGVEEDKAGEPFVGPSGKLLNNMLAAINVKRGKNAYIANIVKCHPPGNRNPEFAEIRQCEPYLARQIELIEPRLIVALGRVAAQGLLHTTATLASLRGRLHDYGGIPVVVTYHPAYLLRTLADKAKAWEDLCLARNTMQRLLQR